MNLNFRQIRAFVTVAKLGSFTRAAQSLHVSQPALTVQIRTLEEALRCRLLDRTSRSVQMTRIGEALLPLLQRTLEDVDSVLANAVEHTAGKRGTIRVASLPSFSASSLPLVISQALRAEPGLQFVIRDAVAHQVMHLVRAEEVDLGITGGAVVTDEFDILQRADDRLCLIVPSSHALAGRRRIHLSDLVDLPLVLTDPATSVRALVEAAFLAIGRRPNIACEATYMMTAVAMVEAGLGATILPRSAREIRAVPDLRIIPIQDDAFVRPISLIKKRGRVLSPACDSFATQCQKAWSRMFRRN